MFQIYAILLLFSKLVTIFIKKIYVGKNVTMNLDGKTLKTFSAIVNLKLARGQIENIQDKIINLRTN